MSTDGKQKHTGEAGIVGRRRAGQYGSQDITSGTGTGIDAATGPNQESALSPPTWGRWRLRESYPRLYAVRVAEGG